MDIEIRRGVEADAEGCHRCVGVVARERRYLGMVDAPDWESWKSWVKRLVGENLPFAVAVSDGAIVGWCDIVPQRRPGFAHAGGLGMGVHPDFRGRGIGPKLLAMAMEQARAAGLERVELEVYASNRRAIDLYRKSGFEVEGVKKRARKLDGRYDDNVMMARLLGAAAQE